ncbi:MAG: trypsin-like peptidase domain-containing protein, partial [Verrucomicrobia bacterium]|nr:trypsin-like peptidase domain-containing protein [Verrucomicrobiota bacterium]
MVESRDPYSEMIRNFFNPYYRRQPAKTYSVGSGVIIDEEGYVLTNLHVIRNASRVWVKLADGREFEAEPLVGATMKDVALLKIVSKNGEKFKAVKFAADDDLLLGETVLALGNPFGLGGSVARGILSSKDRRQPREGEPLDVANWLQIDAPINPGNSGGPLVNLHGDLIGINVAVYRNTQDTTPAQGIGFAIPIKRVSEALSEFFTPEFNKGQPLWFGARVRTGTRPLRVNYVQEGSPADRAGLRVGDAVLQVDGKAAANLIDFNRALVAAGGQREVPLQIQRKGEPVKLSVRLVPEKDFFNAELIQRKLGLSLQELTPELASAFGLNFSGGFVVASVDKDSPAAEAQLQRGHVVQAIDGQVPANVTEAAKLLYAKKKGDKARLNVIIQTRQGNFYQRRAVAVELPVR